MIEVVMCKKNLMLKIHRPLKHNNFDFALFRGGEGEVTLILNLTFRRVGWQKFQTLPWKSRGVVGRVAHARSSDPATPPPKKNKIETCTYVLHCMEIKITGALISPGIACMSLGSQQDATPKRSQSVSSFIKLDTCDQNSSILLVIGHMNNFLIMRVRTTFLHRCKTKTFVIYHKFSSWNCVVRQVSFRTSRRVKKIQIFIS